MPAALIFVNGEINDGEMVRETLAGVRQPLVVAADGGARVAHYFDLKVDVLVGDMDSLSAEEMDSLSTTDVEIQRHPPEKDFTDLELALMLVAERGYDWIRIIGSLGGRLDQTLANIYLLALPQLKKCDVRLVAQNQEAYLLYPGQHTIHGRKGDTISLIPLGGAVHGIRTDKLYYPLENETLEFGPARGISNVMDSESATVTTTQGTLLLVHTLGRA